MEPHNHLPGVNTVIGLNGHDPVQSWTEITRLAKAGAKAAGIDGILSVVD